MHPPRTDLDSQSLKLRWKRIFLKKWFREASVLTLTRHHHFKTACFHHSTGVRVTLSTKQDSCMSRQEESCGWRQRTSPPSSPWQAWSVWPPGVPSEATADCPSPPRPQEGPATVYRQQAIDFGSLPLSPDHRNPSITHALAAHSKDGYYLLRLWQRPSISIQAQMEDKGVGVNWSSGTAPMQGLA